MEKSNLEVHERCNTVAHFEIWIERPHGGN